MASSPPLRLPDLHGITVLVVDDNEDAVDVLTLFLQACGAHTLLATSGTDALAHVDTTLKLDVVVTDVAMPMMDGVTFAQKVRAHPLRNRLPIVALTGFHEDYVGPPGFDVFLRKPVDLDELATVIRSLVG